MARKEYLLENSTGTFRYRCACCGNEFEGAPSFGVDTPVFINSVPKNERADRVKLDDDLCIVRPDPKENSDKEIFAIRVTLEIPIHNCPEPFQWGLWVSQSKDSFFRYVETYEEDQSNESSFGWLPVTMPYYGDFDSEEFSGSLACDVNWGPKGQRPTIKLHECDHPLYFDQANGISWDRAVEIAREQLRRIHAN